MNHTTSFQKCKTNNTTKQANTYTNIERDGPKSLIITTSNNHTVESPTDPNTKTEKERNKHVQWTFSAGHEMEIKGRMNKVVWVKKEWLILGWVITTSKDLSLQKSTPEHQNREGKEQTRAMNVQNVQNEDKWKAWKKIPSLLLFSKHFSTEMWNHLAHRRDDQVEVYHGRPHVQVGMYFK